MSSTFTWLDYSERDRRKMLDVIELFNERETRDELGLGGVRDAFADLMFPGTSTIQTRAKYFLFVPWIYLALEDKWVASASAKNRARQLETDLMLAIERSGDVHGLVGRRAKENVQRLASSVYWLGLATWGIRRFPTSQDQYHRSLDQFHAQRQLRRASPREFDGEARIESDTPNWHPGLPEAPAEFPREATFSLSRLEAAYLREQVLTNCAESLLAYILREGLAIEDLENCWDLQDGMPPHFQEQLEHGRNFSEMMWGAQLLYNLMLAERSASPESVDGYQTLLAEWWELIDSRRAAVAAWEMRRFWQIVRVKNPRVSSRAQTFINQWTGLVGRSASLGLAVCPEARALVEHREQSLKGGQSRLHNRRALERWSGAAGAGQMDLRWLAARRILLDILNGLEEKEHA
jgi:hypothetical protein